MKGYAHPVGAIVFGAVLAAAAAQVSNAYYLGVAFMICVYYLCAAGMNVLVGFAGQKSLGQAGLFAAGAYGAALLTTRTEIDPWLALALAAAIAGVAGVLIALPSLRVKGPYLAMVTLAFPQLPIAGDCQSAPQPQSRRRLCGAEFQLWP